MLIVDANVLLYGINPSASRHRAAKRWLEGALRGGGETVGFAWTVLLAFLRVGTQRSAFASPLTVARAFEHIGEWLDAAPAIVIEPGLRHAHVVRQLLVESGTAGGLVSDAHLAALALEHDATVVSFDRDFQRFEGLRTHVPG